MAEKSLAQINQEIAELTAQADRLKAEMRQEGVNKVKALMAELGVSLADLSAGKRKSPSGTVPPKYRDPATGQTWSGRGRLPGWMAAAVEAGKSRDEFLIK